MEFKLLWSGIACQSLENCILKITDRGTETSSTITGIYEGRIYKVDYNILTNSNWETTYLEINYTLNGKKRHFTFEGDGKGAWTGNGKKVPDFNGCMDVDISVTPFTNTLPVRRLRLLQNQSAVIQVIYFDLMQDEIKTVQQKYTCLSADAYQFENVPNDFESTIHVDEAGIVKEYPGLFRLVAVSKK